MPELFLGTSMEDRKEFHELMEKFMEKNKVKTDYHIDDIEKWLEELAQKCFEIGKDAATIWERND
ncbi:MAG: hypothetical protein ACXADW_20720 [Candidatus Hodarchaeales archaeon]|jgi:hypothetical protein